MEFVPGKDKIAIKKEDVKSPSGIYIPESATTEITLKARVIGSSLEGYSAGDIVAYYKGHAIPVSVNNELIYVLKEEDILGKLV